MKLFINMFRRSRVSDSSSVSGDLAVAVNHNVYYLDFPDIIDYFVEGLDAF